MLFTAFVHETRSSYEYCIIRNHSVVRSLGSGHVLGKYFLLADTKIQCPRQETGWKLLYLRHRLLVWRMRRTKEEWCADCVSLDRCVFFWVHCGQDNVYGHLLFKFGLFEQNTFILCIWPNMSCFIIWIIRIGARFVVGEKRKAWQSALVLFELELVCE